MFKTAAAIALSLAALTANAGPILNMDGACQGASLDNFFNGGTDSLGCSSGLNYGITFTGGTVQYNQDGAWLNGRTRMSFAPGAAGIGVAFLADGWFLDSMSWTYKGEQRYEPWMVESMSYQPPVNGMNEGKVPGYYQGMVWPGRIWLEPDVTAISFNTWALRDIMLDTRDMPAFTQRMPGLEGGGAAGEVITGEVPLPGTAWLVGLGMFAILWRRYQERDCDQGKCVTA